MTTEVRTPFGAPASIELSNDGLYRKQILKFGTIWYTDRTGKRRKVTFDKDYGKDLVEAFKSGAYEQVPFQIADKDNRHTNDPTRTGGEVVALSLSPDGSGVDAALRLWGEGNKAVELNHKLGVSARILENAPQPDGRTYPRALQHVLGTVDPQVRGMRPWERLPSVELSNGSVSEYLDLSNATYEGSAKMPQKKTGEDGELVTLELSTAQRDRLVALLDEDEALAELEGQLKGLGIDLDEDDDDEVPPAKPKAKAKKAARAAAGLEDDEDDDDDEEGDDGVELSGRLGEAVELANAQLESQGQRIIELTNALADTRVENEVAEFMRGGLAPAVLEAARPLLAIESGAVELSNGVGDSLDPGQVLRDVLTTVVELANSGHLLVDPDHEDGSLRGTDAQASTRQALLADWENYG